MNLSLSKRECAEANRHYVSADGKYERSRQMITVFFRTIVIYAVLLISVRIMGKRQLGELELSELITTLMVSELAVLPISDKRIPVLYGIVPILVLLSVEVILSQIITVSPQPSGSSAALRQSSYATVKSTKKPFAARGSGSMSSCRSCGRTDVRVPTGSSTR